MKFTNHSQQNPISFLLMGIPGLEASHFWIAFPFCSMYTLAVLSNMAVERYRGSRVDWVGRDRDLERQIQR